MSFHRATFVALATLFTVGMTSIASACCGWGYSAPMPYPAVSYTVASSPLAYGGCGGCGAPIAPAPIAVTAAAVTPFGGPCCNWNGCGDCGYGGWGGWGNSGCGNCGSGGFGGWGGWGNGCGNCGGCGGCGRGVVYAMPSLYVVNQGPYYSGPGITVPYTTYSPGTAYAPATDYPYVPGSGYGAPAYPGYGYGAPAYPGYAHPYYRPRYAYRAPMYMRPRYYGPGPRYYGAPHWRRYP